MVEVPGLTVMAAVVAPVLHTYVDAPEAVSVVDAPLQIVVVPDMDTENDALTEILVLVLAVQPFEPVTVTV